jgi:hypothetical protein
MSYLQFPEFQNRSSRNFAKPMRSNSKIVFVCFLSKYIKKTKSWFLLVLFLSGIFVGKLGGLVVLSEGQEGRDVGVKGLVRVDLAVGTVLAKVDLVL